MERLTRLTRLTRGGLLAAALALAVAAPAAATQPTRSIFHPTGGLHPAGEGCAFDISFVDAPGARIVVTDFADGREASDVHAVATLTNVSNGKTFVHKAFFHDVFTYDASTGIYTDVTDGQVIAWLLPGDMGPWGVVGANGLAVRVVGTIWSTFDENANAVTQFSYVGTVTNICEVLS